MQFDESIFEDPHVPKIEYISMVCHSMNVYWHQWTNNTEAMAKPILIVVYTLLSFNFTFPTTTIHQQQKEVERKKNENRIQRV